MAANRALIVLVAVLSVLECAVAVPEAGWRPNPYLEPPTAADAAKARWTDVRTLTLRGRAFNDTAAFYNRLPAAAKGVVRVPVWELSLDTAGFVVFFKTNASTLLLNYTLLSSSLDMIHFPRSGVSGCDCYMWDEGNATWRWVGTTTNIVYPVALNTLATDLPVSAGNLNLFRLHLPMYNGVKEMKLGIPDAEDRAIITPYHEYAPQPPIVWYGTSIAQGGVASRPGQAYTRIVARDIGREIWNFGFSGNGIMEETVAMWLTRIDAAVFVIDCLPNMTPDMVANRTVPLVRYFREKHPTTPIVLSEGTTYGQAWLLASVRDTQQAKRNALRACYNELLAAGDKHLWYVTGDQLLRIDGDLVNPTVAGTHPTDLGQYQMAKYYKSFLPKVLASKHATAVPMRFLGGGDEALPGAGRTQAAQAPGPRSAAPAPYTWLDLVDLGIRGRAFNDTPTPYSRLPAAAQGHVREPVWELSQFSTGLYVAFETDSPSIMINYTTTHDAVGLWHMPTTGTSGCDLYRYDPGNKTWRFAATVFDFEGKNHTIITRLVDGLPSGRADYMLYLPLRNSLVQGSIGVEAGSMVQAGVSDATARASGMGQRGSTARPEAAPKPIVWYGTSILQGGVASRAGQAYTNVLSRRIGRDILNFGFAGNGKMELDVAQYLTLIDAAMIIIDCLPNLDASEVAARTQPLVRFFRQAHPTIPIVLVEGTTYGAHWYSDAVASAQDAKRAALRTAYDALVKAGDTNLVYVTGDQLFGHPLINPTVGGTHPSDLGQYDIVDYYQHHVLPEAL